MSRAANPLLGYYKWHARIYDATRWSFLFGRERLVQLAKDTLEFRDQTRVLNIVEVGCGTGRNLASLARAFPEAGLTGLDLCAPMLRRAQRTVARKAPQTRLVCATYDRDSLPEASTDLIIFSYALSMFNPGYEEALDAAQTHLRPGGIVAVADFRHSPLPWFRAWMGVNHVRLDGHLPPALARRFDIIHEERRPAYGGLWDYFCGIGRKA